MRELFPIFYVVSLVAVLAAVIFLFINRNRKDMKEYCRYTFTSIGAVGKQTYNWIGKSSKEEG